MKIATWNVNSIRARIENLCDWLQAEKPDILLLQEIKAMEETFPYERLTELGYKADIVGQKSYNGVAILSKLDDDDFEITARSLPDDEADGQARYIELCYKNGLTIASLYLPNGNPLSSEKFDYKIAWMTRFNAHAKKLLSREKPVILGGDFNLIPDSNLDVYTPKAMANDALTHPESRQKWHELLWQGYVDAYRNLYPNAKDFSYWDYQRGAWQKNEGFRIDHFLLSPEAADMLVSCHIDKEVRGAEKASDHVPVMLELAEKSH